MEVDISPSIRPGKKARVSLSRSRWGGLRAVLSVPGEMGYASVGVRETGEPVPGTYEKTVLWCWTDAVSISALRRALSYFD